MTAGQRSLLFSEVNDRIYELLESADPDLPGEFLCECGDDCGRRILLVPKVFLKLREAGQLVQSPDCTELADGVPVLGLRRAPGLAAHTVGCDVPREES